MPSKRGYKKSSKSIGTLLAETLTRRTKHVGRHRADPKLLPGTSGRPTDAVPPAAG